MKKLKGTKKVATAEETKHSRGAGGQGKPLVIVESPAKAKTINKYLGEGYVVRACKGHVRDLPQRRYGVDPGRNFEPTYEVLSSHRKILTELKHHADSAPLVYLATDLDREGEAIAWHLTHALELPANKIKRVVFNEITRGAIKEAFSRPHDIEMPKVEAQQARRILDRVVGYELSPLLWKKIAKGLSAGRVQSVAVRMIVDREVEIRNFEPQEYWAVDGAFTPDLDKAGKLTAEWGQFLAAAEKGDGSPTGRDRAEWLSERGCFEAELSEVSEKSFRPEGKLDRSNPKEPKFASAAEEVRPVVESIGYHVARVDTIPWKEYAHLGLSRITLAGETRLASVPRFAVKSVDTKRMRPRPSAPFTTASLQQAAANQLRFQTSKTMKVAQSLYEGVDLKTGEGSVGLITYMRTDSTNLSSESVQAVRRMIQESFGDKYVPEKPNVYASSKQAQEAHEAIRPTDVTRTPESLRGHLAPEQHRLYTLIWNRFVACQMTEAAWDSTIVLVSAKTAKGEVVFKASGRVLVFDGFYKVMGVPKNGDSQDLPALKVGQQVMPLAFSPEQKFTAPPARFSEASLVKALEAEGIGRPSTYAAIIKTIQDRGYVEQEDRRFHPTGRGEVVTEKLVEHFPKIMDLRFTSHVEEDLDKIEEQHMDWHEVLHEFYDPFKESLAKAHEEMEPLRAKPSEYTCEVCGRPMVYRQGRNGQFLACSGYPECTSAKDVDRNGKVIETPKVDTKCELCGRAMIVRRSRTGPFLGCSGYPECSSTRPCDESGVPLKKVRPEEISQACPECGAAMQVKFGRGRSFLGCSKYPECKATSPMPAGVYVERPKPQAAGVRCDKCGRAMVIRKSRRGPFLSCSGFPKCRNAMSMDKIDHLKALEAGGKIPPEPATNGSNGNGNGGAAARAKSRGPAKPLSKEQIAGLGPPPAGFAWTRTGRPVVEVLPAEPLRCFECGGEMGLRTGRYGPFFGCASCKAVANLRGEAKKQAEAQQPASSKPAPIDTDLRCPQCGGKMVLRMGRTGRFLGCSQYPKCRKTMEVPPGLLREVAGTTA